MTDPDGSPDRDDAATSVPWWRSPVWIGGGLAAIVAIAVVAVLALRGDDDTDTTSPTTSESVPDTTLETAQDTTPETTTSDEATTSVAPSTTGLGPKGVSLSVDAGCITVSTVEGSATGCPEQGPDLEMLDQRTFVANLGGPVLITSGSSDPLADLTATVDDGTFAARCRWNDLAPHVPSGGLVEVAVCNDAGVMGVPTGLDAGGDRGGSYFTLPTPYLPDGAELGPGASVAGLPGALAFIATEEDIGTCTILLRPDRSGWSEACGLADELEPRSALVRIGSLEPSLHEITIDATGLIVSAQQLTAMSPSSGCSIESANDLARETPASSLVVGIGCIGDTASLTTGSVLTQEGPPDGSIWSARREDDTWTITDFGTGIEDTFAFPVVPATTWSAWPDSTVPGVQADWRELVVGIPAQPTVELFADALLAALGTLPTDPEFPADPRLVAVEPDGLSLIVAQVDIGGDDSVAGAVLYVWLDAEFDDTGPTGWRAGEVLVGFVCARGITPDGDLCI